MEAARGGQIVKDYDKSYIYIFTPSGGSKQNLLGHHRTPRNKYEDITVTLNEKTKSMTYKRLVLILKVIEP